MKNRIENTESDSSIKKTETKQTVSKKNLTNTLNFINFQDRHIRIHFNHRNEGPPIDLDVKPLPTFGKYLVCLWPDSMSGKDLSLYNMDRIYVPGSRGVIELPVDIRRMTRKGLCFSLPDYSPVSSQEIQIDNGFSNIRVQMFQNHKSVSAEITSIEQGRLTVIPLSSTCRDTLSFDMEKPVNVAFIKSGDILFTSHFKILDQSVVSTHVTLKLIQSFRAIHRFPPKEFRSLRYCPKPAPDVVFTHPFTGKYHIMDVSDISGSGFSVIDNEDMAMFLIGMSFQTMELRFSGSLTIRCNAQIVHRTVKEKDADEPSVRYGFAYTDMPIEDHMALQNILHRTDNPNTRICSSVDNDNLWSFFFETGFIYSKKYHEFNSKKHRIKSVYDRLYNQPLDVSRHFTYQENGKILGHLSMLRFCNNAWLIHHHAALKKSGIKAGLAVLNQVARFSYNSIWLDACHMGYMYCYFRPENEFPNFFFNGFAERLNDRNGCSTDAFAYYTHKAPSAMTATLPQDWALDTATREDLSILAEHYAKRSGGLMVDAFDLGPTAMPQDELTLKYRNAGLKKERAVLSLRKQGKLAAVFLVNNADEALNMSDLTSCVHAMVVDESLLPKDILSTALNMLSPMFEGNRFPVLLYPFFYAEDQQIPYQKKYVLWILSTRYSDHYFGYLDQVNSLSKNNR